MKKIVVFLFVLGFSLMAGSSSAWAQDDYSDILNIPEAKSQKEAGEILKAWHDRVLERIKASPADIVVKIIKNKSLSPGFRKMILELMRYPDVRTYVSNPQVISSLIEILNDKKDTQRITFSSGKGSLGDQEYVRAEVVDTLATIGGDSVTDILIDILNNDESVFVRGFAASDLWDKKGSLPHLINALKKLENKIGSDQITYYEGQAISRIIHALGRVDDKEATKTIVKLLKNKRTELKKRVPDFVALNIAIYFTLGDMGTRASEAVPILLEELKTVDDRDRGILIKNIGKIKDKRATDTLIKELEGKDYSDAIDAAIALADIGDPKAIKAMEKTLKRKDIKNDSYGNDKLKKAYKKLTGKEYEEKSGK